MVCSAHIEYTTARKKNLDLFKENLKTFLPEMAIASARKGGKDFYIPCAPSKADAESWI